MPTPPHQARPRTDSTMNSRKRRIRRARLARLHLRKGLLALSARRQTIQHALELASRWMMPADLRELAIHQARTARLSVGTYGDTAGTYADQSNGYATPLTVPTDIQECSLCHDEFSTTTSQNR